MQIRAFDRVHNEYTTVIGGHASEEVPQYPGNYGLTEVPRQAFVWWKISERNPRARIHVQAALRPAINRSLRSIA